MGISISGSNAISGLGGNDTDFDKVLENLKKIESTQLNRLNAWKSDWKLRYDAFTQIIEQIQAASSMLSQLSDKNNFVTKNVASSNENIVTAVANASAQDVQHNISVIQTASNAIWANTGAVFDSRTDLINATDKAQTLKYTYGGKDYTFNVPAFTSLDSFASMFNNHVNNPGVKVSIVQTGNGYVYQFAGKDTGVKKDLYIHPCNLKGMDNTNATTNWITNSAIDKNQNVTDPTMWIYDLVLEGGQKKTISVRGDADADELVRLLNQSAGGINASVDAAGQLTIKGVQSFSRRKESDKAYTAGNTKVQIGGELKDKINGTGGLADGLADGDLLDVKLSMEDGSTRTIQVKAGMTKEEFYTAIGQNVGNGSKIELENNGAYSLTLNGVTQIEVSDHNAGGAPLTTGLSQSYTAGTGVKDTLGGQLSSAVTTLTFNKDKLTSRIDGKATGDPAEMLTFTIVDQNGVGQTVTISGDKTNQELIDKLKADGRFSIADSTDDKGNVLLKVDNAKEFRLDGGKISKAGYSASLESTITIDAINNNKGPTSSGDLFYQEPGTGKFLLEKAPDLVYKFKTNDGTVGTLTLPSGTSMQDINAALKNTSDPAWVWKDKDDNPVATPPDLGVRYTDRDGKEYVDAGGNPLALADIDGPIYLNFKDVQTVSGPELSGQISSSSNWSIQRSSNCIYKIDNWPVEMESDTNTISDVIEGVVINVQDVGDARISISTDITSVEQSIQNFLDAVNSVLLTVNELMKVDEDKEVTSNDPEDIGNDNYSPSGLTNQKGNLLTGNYGVQLFKSRFSTLLGTTPPGFKAQTKASDILSGDVLASLSNLGIKTDTDATSDTYGLLVLAPSSSIAEMQSMDKENYDKLITNNLEAVVDFFCAAGIGSSTSTDFRYGSHVQGITKAGVYDVTYSVDEHGNISNVMVGGEPAIQDKSMPGNYFSVASGDPRGLSILIDDLTPGDHPPSGQPAMQVRIKQGLVQTTNDFLKAELVYNDVNISANSTPQQIADAVALKSKNGALMSLRDNYKKVMESIDVKIEREQRRIDTWYNRQKQIFANLETLLAQYDKQQKSLESQLKQLSNN